MRKIILLCFSLLLTCYCFSQSREVHGTITTADKKPVPFATITLVNSKTSATADEAGSFAIKVPAGVAKLQITSTGFEAQTITIAASATTIEITLKETQQDMGEVVVVGYGKQKKLTTVGSIASVSGQEVRQSPSASLQNALVGRLPGLFQVQTSGQPGADAANIFIRGVSTYASGANTSPLVIVDNVEIPYSQLAQMDANEVENISILKDASSTAIFGIKGANGVIVVTTRRGKLGKPSISFRADAGLQMPTVKRKPLPAYDALLLLKEQAVNSGQDPNTTLPGLVTDEALEHFRLGDDPYRYPNVNWYDLLVKKTSLIQRDNVDFSGGTKNLKYFVSAGYLFQNGIFKDIPKQEDFNNNYYLKRYNVRSNIDAQVYPDLTLNLNLSARFNEINEPYLPDVMSGGALPFWRRISTALLAPWVYPVKNEDGSYGGKKGDVTLNPVGILEYAGYDRTYSNNLNLNLTAKHNLNFIANGLSLTGMIAYTSNFGFTRNLRRPTPFFPEYFLNAAGDLEPVFPALNRLPPFVVSGGDIFPDKIVNPQVMLNYQRNFGDHHVTALAVYNTQVRFYSSSTGPANSNFRGYSGRLTYDFQSKYLLEATAGYNGSDRFQSNKRYGLFPAFGVGWVASEEKFFKKALPFVTLFKLRGNYGYVGNDGVGGNQYIYNEVYTRSTGAYYFGETPTSYARIIPGAMPNTNVTWETERKAGLGIDLNMFKNELQITADYFDNLRYDILTTRGSVPAYVGFTLPVVNIGKVSNKGYEIEVRHNKTVGKAFRYFLTGNISIAKNKVVFRDEPSNTANPLLNQTGRPIGQIYGYTADGFYYDEDDIAKSPADKLRNVKPGDLKYRDINGDGVINTNDIGPIGYPSIPQLTYGLSGGFSYKGLDLSVLFQGAGRSSLMANSLLQIGTVNAMPSAIHQKRWTPETRDIAEYPRLGGVSFDNSTFWLREANYLRLKNIELGYRLPKKWSGKMKMSDFRLYANAANLITWFSLNIYDVDPESNRGNGTTDGYSSYPQQKIVNFGIQASF